MTLPTYQTGTVSVANGGTIVTGVSSIWSGTNVLQGDFISIGGANPVLITGVTDTTHLTISPWTGTTQTAVAYVIYQNFVGRVIGVAAAANVSALLAFFNQAGTFYAVSGTVPDPSIGDDGQYALKTNAVPWKLWLKTGGVWVDQGSPVGTNNRGTWSSVTAYVGNDVVGRLGSSYIAKAINTNQPPESSPTYWDVLAVGGANWTSGTTAPSGGRDGDYHLLTTTYDVYKNTAGVWAVLLNIKGAIGNTGATGATGAAATVAINSTTTLAPGASATVTNTGTPSSVSLNFGIPKGDTGIQGPTGATGTGLQPDASGTLAQRAAFDGQTTGFKFQIGRAHV